MSAQSEEHVGATFGVQHNTVYVLLSFNFLVIILCYNISFYTCFTGINAKHKEEQSFEMVVMLIFGQEMVQTLCQR